MRACPIYTHFSERNLMGSGFGIARDKQAQDVLFLWTQGIWNEELIQKSIIFPWRGPIDSARLIPGGEGQRRHVLGSIGRNDAYEQNNPVTPPLEGPDYAYEEINPVTPPL